MNKTLCLTLAFVCCVLCNAQEAETIESIVANSHETEWYDRQAQAWQKVVDADAGNQWAWRNLFRATFYYDMFTDGWSKDQDKSRTADVMRRMESALPDSYVLNLSKCRFCLSDDLGAKNGSYIRRAIDLIPADACNEDVVYLAAQAWLNPDVIPETKTNELFKLAYEKKAVPERIMRYNWNMLQSIAQDGIYFGNGDNCLIPMKMLQEALGIRKDVTIVPESFLFRKPWAQNLWKKLKIPALEYKDDNFLEDVFRHIIK